MPTVIETIQQAIAGDKRLSVESKAHLEEKTEIKKAEHHFVKAGKEVLFKVIVPHPVRLPYTIEEYHEDPAVVCGHPVHKAHLLGPILAALLGGSKETAAILERAQS